MKYFFQKINLFNNIKIIEKKNKNKTILNNEILKIEKNIFKPIHNFQRKNN